MVRTRWPKTTAVLSLLLLGGTAWGRTIKNIDVPETWSVKGTELSLQGAGVRKKFFFSVYVAALYLDTTTGDPARAIRSEEAKAVTMHFLRDVDEDKIRESFQDGFFNNSQERLPQLQGRIDRLLELFAGGVEEGTAVRAVYDPGRGTEVSVGERRTLIEGADFMQALWSIWLGDVPADHGLKRELLGQP